MCNKHRVWKAKDGLYEGLWFIQCSNGRTWVQVSFKKAIMQLTSHGCA